VLLGFQLNSTLWGLVPLELFATPAQPTRPKPAAKVKIRKSPPLLFPPRSLKARPPTPRNKEILDPGDFIMGLAYESHSTNNTGQEDQKGTD
jgi:hypothetical protein